MKHYNVIVAYYLWRCTVSDPKSKTHGTWAWFQKQQLFSLESRTLNWFDFEYKAFELSCNM